MHSRGQSGVAEQRLQQAQLTSQVDQERNGGKPQQRLQHAQLRSQFATDFLQMEGGAVDYLETANVKDCELVRLSRVSQEMHQLMLASDKLQLCRDQVVAAGCEVQPDWANGAILLAPVTHEMIVELGVLLRSHHVCLLRKDRHLLDSALNEVPCRRRPHARLERNVGWPESSEEIPNQAHCLDVLCDDGNKTENSAQLWSEKEGSEISEEDFVFQPM